MGNSDWIMVLILDGNSEIGAHKATQNGKSYTVTVAFKREISPRNRMKLFFSLMKKRSLASLYNFVEWFALEVIYSELGFFRGISWGVSVVG